MYISFPKDRQPAPFPDDAGDPPTPPLDPPRRRIGRRGMLIALAAALLIAFAGYRWFGGSEAQADAAPPPTVTVASPLQRDIIEYEDFTGRFEASQAVEIRPRVSGQLVGVHFRDGDLVRRGQLLFTIDERPFRAALTEAQARLAEAQSALALANSEYARAARLVDDEAVSREEVESLAAAVRSRTAQVAAAQAVVRQRALDLEFTRVRAPISGRVSDRRIDSGNIVAANESLLTTVLSLDPIHFAFDGSEALHLKAMRERQAGGEAATEVEIRLQDEADYAWRGRVDFSDNAIDPGSGTLRARAVVDNPGHFLTPGMFGEMRLASGSARPALLIPDAAVQTDQARKIVLVVQPDGTVAARPVEIGARIGSLRSIRAGLSPNDRVVVEGVQYAQPGSQVNVRRTRIAPPAEPADAAARTPQPAPAASHATLAG
ncbi:efflux RND transporter periplasmic adaptor subunit [Sphingosinicella sp. CPCC 101087]|uniref:efflux RND transporter periplasmic adaptor subunit n=1 Tax=Sphingosinicella sp. CPCC 101087 TaxID=2497754 RepID=UPI001FB1123E|nr:efflux RND transporter periplasmic adaptor subunit [Sphingosinicella sp. CPCC 101087]